MTNVVVFGIGNIAKSRHLPCLSRRPDVKIVGVVNTTRAGCEEVCRQFAIPQFWTLDEFINTDLPPIDAAVICTPPFTHFRISQLCLERNWHVLSEKPFTLTVSDADELLALAQERSVTISVVHNFQFSSGFLQLKRDLGNGALGTVRNLFGFQCSNLERRLPVWYEDIPLGLFYDEAPHLLYLMDNLAPGLQLQTARGFFAPRRVTPLQVDLALSDHRVPVQITMNFDSPISEWYCVVYGEKAVGFVDIFRDIYVRLPNDHQHLPSDILRTSWQATWQHWRGFFSTAINVLRRRQFFGDDALIRLWLNQVKTGKIVPEISGQSAKRIIQLLSQIDTRLDRTEIHLR